MGQLGLKSGGGFLAWAHPMCESGDGTRRQMEKEAAFWFTRLRCREKGVWWVVGAGRPRGWEGGPVEGRENWSGGLLLLKRGGLSIWRMRLGRLA
jgi:hypothetical protein